MKRTLKTAGIALAAVAGAAAVAALVVRDQLDRHQRDLFSPYPLRRLACLGHLARAEASVGNITLGILNERRIPVGWNIYLVGEHRCDHQTTA